MSTQTIATNAIVSLCARTACSFLSSATRCTLRAPSEKPDHRHRRLLRARRERPSGRDAAEKGDELSPPYVPPPTSGEGFLLAKTIALWKEARAGFHRICVRADFPRGVHPSCVQLSQRVRRAVPVLHADFQGLVSIAITIDKA